MENKLIIKKTEETPAIIFNPIRNVFQFVGTSWPENAKEFYDPIIAWIQDYFNNKPNEYTTFNFMLEYFNTASSKQIARILSLLKSESLKHNVNIHWHFEKEDFDINKEGRRFAEILGLQIEFIAH